MSMIDITPLELLTTTRTVRKRLDLSRPVDRSLVEECLRIAWQAPNGSNQQMYGWVCVDDPATKAAMADVYRDGLKRHQEISAANPSPYKVNDRQELISASVFHLLQHMQDVPVLVVPTIETRLDGGSIFEQGSRWGSILPAVWNFMLALRMHGMGSAWTTLHLHCEKDMADLLGIPFAEVTQAGMFPVAYTIGTDFHAASRAHSEQTIHWNKW